MYMRVTTVHGDPSRIDDVVALVRNRAKPVVDRSEDGRGMSVFVDREKGRVVATSAWATAQARAASNTDLAPLRDEAARLMAGTVRTAEYEIALTEQVVPPGPGCWLRATTLTAEPARIREAVAAFQTTVIPALRGVPGFCGAMLLVDQASGTGIGSTVWISREALEASRDIAGGLRGDVATQTGGQVAGVAEYEVVLAATKLPRYEHLFRRAYELMSTGNLADLDEVIADDLVEHAPIPPDFPPGREGVKAFMAEYRKAFPDLRMTIEKYLEQGDLACAVARVTGTNTGSLMGNPPTGKSMDVTMVDIVRVVDGKAAEHWGAGDDLGMLTQLGLAGAAPAIPGPRTIELGSKVDA